MGFFNPDSSGDIEASARKIIQSIEKMMDLAMSEDQKAELLSKVPTVPGIYEPGSAPGRYWTLSDDAVTWTDPNGYASDPKYNFMLGEDTWNFIMPNVKTTEED